MHRYQWCFTHLYIASSSKDQSTCLVNDHIVGRGSMKSIHFFLQTLHAHGQCNWRTKFEVSVPWYDVLQKLPMNGFYYKYIFLQINQRMSHTVDVTVFPGLKRGQTVDGTRPDWAQKELFCCSSMHGLHKWKIIYTCSLKWCMMAGFGS